jgi:hypothetical protein
MVYHLVAGKACRKAELMAVNLDLSMTVLLVAETVLMKVVNLALIKVDDWVV